MLLEERLEALEKKVNKLLQRLDEDEIKRRSDMYLLSHLGAENLRDGAITAEKIAAGAIIIGPGTVFAEGYNPIEKATDDDLQTAIDSLGDLAFEDMVESAMLGTTIIQGGYIRSELLTADNIVTGTMSANRIYGGTISGVTIDVDTDATIGNKLFLSDTNFGNGIRWGSTADMEIYIDPAGKSLTISASGGVWANNQRIDTSLVAVFG